MRGCLVTVFMVGVGAFLGAIVVFTVMALFVRSGGEFAGGLAFAVAVKWGCFLGAVVGLGVGVSIAERTGRR